MSEFDPAEYDKLKHSCIVPGPYATFSPKGWRCDDCGKAWRLMEHWDRGEWWKQYERMPEADEARQP